MRLFAQADGHTRLELDRVFRVKPRVEVSWRMLGDRGKHQDISGFRLEGQNLLIRPLDTIDWDSPVAIDVTQRSRFLGRVATSKIIATIVPPRSFEGGVIWGECVNPFTKTSRLSFRWRWRRPPAPGVDYKVQLFRNREDVTLIAESIVGPGQTGVNFQLKVVKAPSVSYTPSQSIYVQFLETSHTAPDLKLAEFELEIPGKIS